MSKRALRLFLALVALTTVASCGNRTAGLPIAGEIDVRHLDVGPFSAEPIDTYTQYSHSVESGSELATMRLSNHMATGLDFDRRLTFGTSAESMAASSSDLNGNISKFKQVLSEASARAILQNGVLFGFASGSSDHEPDRTGQSLSSAILTNLSVFQFPSPEKAARAAVEMEQADFDVAPDKNQSVTLGKYPDARSHWQPGTPTLGSFIAHGNYVVTIFAKIPEGRLPELSAITEKAFDKQIPMLDNLVPLSAEEVLKLEPNNSTNRRIITPAKHYIPSNESLGTYEKQGFLHFQKDRAAAKKMFDALHIESYTVSDAYLTITTNYDRTGNTQALIGKEVTRNVTGGAILYQAADSTAARTAWQQLLESPDATTQPKGVPDSKCAQLPDDGTYRQFSCAVMYHQYVAVVWGRQLADAQQRAAAEYALLANSEWM